jgi:hypothetical protein
MTGANRSAQNTQLDGFTSAPNSTLPSRRSRFLDGTLLKETNLSRKPHNAGCCQVQDAGKTMPRNNHDAKARTGGHGTWGKSCLQTADHIRRGILMPTAAGHRQTIPQVLVAQRRGPKEGYCHSTTQNAELWNKCCTISTYGHPNHPSSTSPQPCGHTTATAAPRHPHPAAHPTLQPGLQVVASAPMHDLANVLARMDARMAVMEAHLSHTA